jgi:hypothetical protein
MNVSSTTFDAASLDPAARIVTAFPWLLAIVGGAALTVSAALDPDGFIARIADGT